MTDDEIRNWETWEDEVSDNLHEHFETYEHWTDVWIESVRVIELLFYGDGVEIHLNSPMSSFLSLICAASAHTVVATLSKALGVNAYDIDAALEAWEINPDKPTVGWDGFRKLVENAK